MASNRGMVREPELLPGLAPGEVAFLRVAGLEWDHVGWKPLDRAGWEREQARAHERDAHSALVAGPTSGTPKAARSKYTPCARLVKS
jgi:hypothetical protein